MAETLGMLCDKLTIVKLKQYHTSDLEKISSLNFQCEQLKEEINTFVSDSFSRLIPVEKLTFSSNKVFKNEGNLTRDFTGKIGDIFYHLADINCNLWHEQEKVYEFENVPIHEKDSVVKKLAILNLERNKCIDSIDSLFKSIILTNK
jgi:hypothetical protein